MLTPLKFQRLARDIKAIDLAEKAGISIALLSQIETGRIGASKRAKEKIAEAMNLPKEMLFGNVKG